MARRSCHGYRYIWTYRSNQGLDPSHMVAHLRSLVVLLFIISTFCAFGQLPTVDITGQPAGAGSELEVRIRPDAFFNGLFSSIVFTVRWEEASGISLGDAMQNLPQVQYCAITKSGPEQVQGIYRYQIFVGFGNIPLSSLSTSWLADQEVVLCRIPILGGSGPCILAEDAWTMANNGDFFVSLNGEDRTGVIYGISTGIAAQQAGPPSLAVMPNPTNGPARVVLSPIEGGQEFTLRILDATGREAVNSIRSTTHGTLDLSMDLGALPSGVYMLELVLPHSRLTERLVLTGR